MIGYLAEQATARNFGLLALGQAANLAYVIVPNAIQTTQVDRPGALSAAKYNTWLPTQLQLTAADTGVVYPNDQVFSFVRLDLEITRAKMRALLAAMLSGTNNLNGFYIDLLDSSVAYPSELTALLREFKRTELNAGRREPVIATNLASLRAYLNTRYFDTTPADTSTLPSTFDLVVSEEYGNPRFTWPDKLPADVIDFHERYPAILIIVNVRFKMNTFPETYQTTNPNAVPDTPCMPPFADPRDTDHARVREAVTVAALVGGLHAVDDGTQCHGQNTYARTFLNFPILQVGKPVASLQNTTQFYRRDYERMIAIYAKTGGVISLPLGDWTDYWNNQGAGPVLNGSIAVSQNTSYLLFKR